MAAAALNHSLRLCSLLALLVLAGCGTFEREDGTPSRRLDPDAIEDAVPRRDPITNAGNKSPYTVLGKTYRVLPASKGYRARGRASWYGTKFHGQNTSNGERYDVYGMTAAHCTLPIPTYVQVTNLENGRSVIVRVNDRGPFVNDRLIDLSYAAAVKLGYAHKGTALVEVAAIDVDNWPPSKAIAQDAPPPPRLIAPSQQPQPVAEPPLSPRSRVVSGDKPGYFVQAGAFQSRITAEKLQQRLAGVTRYPVLVQMSPSPVLFRVRIGPLASRAEAEQLREQLVGHVDGARIVDEWPAPR